MANRSEEKARRRQEREAAEAADRQAKARRQRAGLALGGLLAAALVATVLVLVLGGGGEGTDGANQAGEAPAFGVTDLAEAARLAECRVAEHPIEGRTHVQPSEQVQYRTNPPTSGNHAPTWLEDGDYSAVPEPVDLKMAVHTLEHGRIDFQYRPDVPPQRKAQMVGLFNEEVAGAAGYRSLLYENQTSMPHAVAATAWGFSLTCGEWNDRVFDALRAFRIERNGKGPEPFP